MPLAATSIHLSALCLPLICGVMRKNPPDAAGVAYNVVHT